MSRVRELRYEHDHEHGSWNLEREPEPGLDPGGPQQDDFVSLYRNAFKEFGARALWNMRPVDESTQADALAITQALRTHGGMDGRRLAERIERLCRAG
ncbi:MAG: hypothetical protein P4L43_03925 [Syntrophobacteraceae bacterium]|nr:hypothetical protein [Syntrophobacteraceae bacterium]